MGIRTRLISFTSLLLVAALSAMILLATEFFREDTLARIQESNLRAAELLASRSELELETFTSRAEGVLRQGSGSLPRALRLLFVGRSPPWGSTGPVFTQTLFDERLLAETGLTRETILAALTDLRDHFEVSLAGGVGVVNISHRLNAPAIAVTFPVEQPGGVGFTVVEPRGMLKVFRGSGFSTAFLVDEQGFVVAHPEENSVLAREDLRSLPIVQELLKSKVDNKQMSFSHRNVSYVGSFKKIDRFRLGVVSMVEEERAFEGVYRIRQRNVYIMLVVTNLAVIALFFFGRRITRPILDLAQVARDVERGHYQIQIAPAPNHELGVLRAAFLSMTRGLAEREKFREALVKFANHEVAERAARGELRLGGERKVASVLFADLRGFTKLSEALSPEELLAFLNHYFEGMVTWVYTYGGSVDKFIGDAILAHFGIVQSLPNSAESAVRAALMMRRVRLEMNRMNRSQGKTPVAFGCGVNTGPLVAGQIGTMMRMEFTVIGDTVNVAQRLEQLTKEVQTDILITEETKRLVEHLVKVEALPPARLKGKSEPVAIYAVLGLIADPHCPRSLGELRSLLSTIDGVEVPRERVV